MRRVFMLTLTAKIALLACATAIVVAVGCLGVVAVSLRVDLERRVERHVQQDASALRARLTQEQEVLGAAVNAAATGPLLKATLSALDIDEATLAGIAESERTTLGNDLVALLDPDGMVRASSPLVSTTRLLHEQTDEADVAAFGVRLVDGRVYITALRPVDVGATRVGYLFAARELSEAFLNSFRDERGSEAVLLADGEARSHTLAPAGAQAVLASIGNVGPSVASVDAGHHSFLATRVDVGPSLSAVLLRDPATEFSGFTRTLLLLVAVGVASACIAGFFGLLVARRISRPLRELTNVASRVVRDGDFSQRIRLGGTDEVGELAGAFAGMMDKFRNVLGALGDSAQLLKTAAEELTVTASYQGDAIARQTSALQQTHATVEQIKESSALAAEKAGAVLAVAERADEVSQSGEASVEGSALGLHDIRTQVLDIASRMTTLAERTRQIGSIAYTVKDFADQSNVLALNAAIEAARAGEHGKSFGVVAREVRTLAAESIAATDRVKKILDDVAQSIKQAVEISESGVTNMEVRLAQVRAAGESLRELSVIVKQNSVAMRQIADTIWQQNDGIVKIFDALDALSEIADDSSLRVEATTQAAMKLQHASAGVTHLLSSYRIQ